MGQDMKPETKRWTSDEDEILRKEALAGSPVTEIASKIGRSESAVRTRAYTLRVPLRMVGMRRSVSAW
jgi:DNA-directed RNA polymerase specialized sigma24 family protein